MQGQMPWMHDSVQGSVEMPSSPVRDRMKHAVERESCLRCRYVFTQDAHVHLHFSISCFCAHRTGVIMLCLSLW